MGPGAGVWPLVIGGSTRREMCYVKATSEGNTIRKGVATPQFSMAAMDVTP
jgi:hypothetical protein